MSTEFVKLLGTPPTGSASELPGAAPGPARAGVTEPLGEPVRPAGRVSLEQVLEALWEELAERRSAVLRAAGESAAVTGEGAERPYVLLNMISTADGRATIDGRSGPLGSRGDRELFHGLRSLVDGVLVGARTLRVERYNRIIDDPAVRARRRERGLAGEALACVVSRSLELDPAIPLLADEEARVVILTPSEQDLPGLAAARVRYVRRRHDGELDLGAALQALNAELEVGLLLCEGGPHLAWQLFADGLVDELFLTLAPQVAGGDIASSPAGSRGTTGADHGAGGAALPLLSGAELPSPSRLELAAVLESDSYLFLRYRVAR